MSLRSNRLERAHPKHFHVVLIILTIAFYILSPCDAYSCHDKQVLTSPSITAGEAVSITNCNFTELFTISINPSTPSIAIDTAVFNSGLTIQGSSAASSGGAAHPVQITMVNVHSKSTVSIESIDFAAAAKFSMSKSLLHSMVLSYCNFSTSVELDTVTVTARVRLTNVQVQKTSLRFVNSHIESALGGTYEEATLYFTDTSFDHGAQLVFEHTVLKSRYDVINFFTTNSTVTRYYHFNMFRNGAVLNFTNVTGISDYPSSYCVLRAYNAYSSGSSAWYRYVRFGSGSKLVATNSRFMGKFDVYFVEGATAEIDAASYEDIDLTLEGDGDQSTVIPIPHRISVERLALSKCRVHLPDLNVAVPLQNTWDVRVTEEFKVHDVRLANNQQLLLRPTTEFYSSVTVTISKLLLVNSSVMSIQDMKLVSCTIDGRVLAGSFLSIVGAQAGHLVLRHLVLHDRGGILLNDSTVSTHVAVGPITATHSSMFLITNCTMNSYVLFQHVEMLSESTLSFSNSFIQGVGADRPVVKFLNTTFNRGALCIRDSVFEDTCTYRVGILHFVGTAANHLAFSDGSSFLMSNSQFRCTLYPSTNMVSNKVGTIASSFAAMGGRGERGSNGTTIVVHNTTFFQGTCRLFVRGNGTNVLLDPLTLAAGGVVVTSDVTTIVADDDLLDAVVVYLPSSFTASSLGLQGVSVRWLPDVDLDLLAILGVSSMPSLSPSLSSPSATINVMKELSLQQPLKVHLPQDALLIISPAAEADTSTTLLIEGLSLRNGSGLVVSNPAGRSISSLNVKHCYVEGSASFIAIENVSLVHLPLVVSESTVAGGGTMRIQNVSSPKGIELSKVVVVNESVVVITNASTVERGLTFLDSSLTGGSSLMVQRCLLEAAAGWATYGAVDIRGSTVIGTGTTMILDDCSLSAASGSVGVGVGFNDYSKLADGAVLSLSTLRISVPTTAVVAKKYSRLSSQLLLQDLAPEDGKQIDATLDGGQLLIGSGVPNVELVLKSHSAATLNSTLACSSASTNICSGATITPTASFPTVLRATTDAESLISTAASSATAALKQIEAASVTNKQRMAPMLHSAMISDDERRIASNEAVSIIVDELQCPALSQFEEWRAANITTRPPTTAPPPPPPTEPADPSTGSSTITPSATTDEPPSTVISTPPTSPGDTNADNTSAPTDTPQTTSKYDPTTDTVDATPTASPTTTQAPTNTQNVSTPEPSKQEDEDPVTDDAPQAVKVTVTTTAATATAVGVAASASGGAAAADMQTTMVLGFTTCASDAMRSVARASRRTLFPLGEMLGDFEASRLLGNYLLLGIVGVVQLCATAIYSKTKKKRFGKAAALLKYPSMTLLLANFVYQGVALEASFILFRKDDTESRGLGTTAVAVVSLAGSIAMPIAYALWCRKNISSFSFYWYDHSRKSRVLGLFVFPTGQWDPHNQRLCMYRNVCGMLSGSRWWMFSPSTQIRSLFVAMIATNQHLACTVQAVLLCLVFMIHGCVLVAFRPLRMRATNVFSPLASFLSGVLALTLFVESLAKYSSQLLMVTSCVAVCGAVVQLGSMLTEKTWKKRKKCRYINDEGPASSDSDSDGGTSGSGSSGSGKGSSDTSSDEEDEEMTALNVPMLPNDEVEEIEITAAESSQTPNHNPLSLGNSNSPHLNADFNSSFSPSDRPPSSMSHHLGNASVSFGDEQRLQLLNSSFNNNTRSASGASHPSMLNNGSFFNASVGDDTRI